MLELFIQKLLVVDTETLISALVWDSFSAVFVLLAFWKFSDYVEDTKKIKHMVILRGLYMFTFLMLLLRGIIPLFFSSTLGNLMLFICHYLETQFMLTMIKRNTPRLRMIQLVTLIAVSIIYIVQDAVFGNANFRVALSSAAIFFILLPFIIQTLGSKKTLPVGRIMGALYLPLLLAIVPRIYYALLDHSFNIHTSHMYQTYSFLALLIKSYCVTLFFFLFMKIETDQAIQKLATSDSLTGLFNRHTYFEHGQLLLEQCRRDQVMMGIYFMDIDSFKLINDKFSHAVGDQVLTEFAVNIRKQLRTNDICGRYGGDEFTICITFPDIETALTIAERIREGTKQICVGGCGQITTSMGIAYGIPGPADTFADFVARADHAMYMAKNTGKDKIVILPLHE